jgi:hypothetical protein
MIDAEQVKIFEEPCIDEESEEVREDPVDWKDEWQGMPEFIQEKIIPYCRQITVRFETEENYEEFGKLVEQNLTDKTKTIWYPKLIRGIHSSKRYIDES